MLIVVSMKSQDHEVVTHRLSADLNVHQMLLEKCQELVSSFLNDTILQDLQRVYVQNTCCILDSKDVVK